MILDMLEFVGDELYFDEAIAEEAKQCIEKAAKSYGDPDSENLLYRAYFIEPENPMVLVALYRYFYYQHQYRDALTVAKRILKIFAQRLGLPDNWRQVESEHMDAAAIASMVDLRFYLFTLKGAGYLELRLELYDSAIERLQKVVDLDLKDRLGAASLLEIAKDEVNRKAGIYRLKF